MKNVEQLQGDVDRFEARVEELVSELARDPFRRGAMDAADFSSRAQNVADHFRRRAEDLGVELPSTLEEGFSYYTSGGAIPECPVIDALWAD